MSATDAPSTGFLDRWSARKRDPELLTPEGAADPVIGVVSESAAVAPGSMPSEAAQPAISALDESDTVPAEAPLLTDDDMPPIASLDASSDVSDFFNRGVSAALRRAALRQIFRSPSYNVRDGLNDYDGDFTQFEPLGDTITSDMKFHAARKERARLAREAELQEAEAAERQSQALQESPAPDEQHADRGESEEAMDSAEQSLDPAPESEATAEGAPADTTADELDAGQPA